MRGIRTVRVCSFLFICIIQFQRCAGPFQWSGPLPEIDPDILINKLQIQANKLQTFQGRAKITVASSLGAFSGSLTIIAKQPDSIFMKIEGPLGIDLGSALFGGDTILVYNAWDNLAYKGSVRNIGIRDFLPMSSNPPLLTSSMFGILIPDLAYKDNLHSVSAQGKQYVLTFSNGELFWVRPKGPVVTRWEQYTSEQKKLWSWEASKFRNERGLQIPYIIRMTAHQPRQRLTLYYENMKINRSLKSSWFNMKIPEGVEIFEL